MDPATREELEKLRADAIALCDTARELAERTVEVIDAQFAAASHRKPRRHLTVVKGLITGAAAAVALRKLAGVAAASAVTAAAVSVLIVPAVTAPHGPPGGRPPAVSHVKRGRRVPVVQPSSRPSPGVTVPAVASSAPVPSSPILPLPSVSVPVPSVSPTCNGIVVLGVCIPLGGPADTDHDGDLA